MDVLSPLIDLSVKSLVVLFPLTVGWLSFRRLALSTSSNAWIYAVMCLFSAVSAAGVAPWAVGLTTINLVSLGCALVCPALWVGVIMVCDTTQGRRYGPDPIADAAKQFVRPKAPEPAPLILENPDFPKPPEPIFRHREKPAAEPTAMPPSVASTGAQNILSLARGMRTNATSEKRRPKLLPAPPRSDYPFVDPSRSET